MPAGSCPATAIALAASLACGCVATPPCPSGDLSPPPRSPRFAVLLSDYASSAVALLDARGDVITESWLDSGTRLPGLLVPLGGDAVLPRQAWPSRIAVLERYEADRLRLARLDRVEIATIDLRGDDPIAPRGHSPNPQDVLALAGARALVSRYNPAVDPSTPELARGNDLVLLDLDAGRIEARIDLHADVEVPAAGGDRAGRTTIAYARPASLALLTQGATRRVLVGLDRSSRAFDTTGPGAMAAVDPETLAPTQILEIEALSGCGALAPVPGDEARAVVLCTGDAFATEAARRRESGIVRVALDPTGTVRLETTWRAREHPEAPAPTAAPLPIDATRLLYVADPRGEPGGQDRLVLLDLEDRRAEVLLQAQASFVLGNGALDPDRSLVLVPDAAELVVHRFTVEERAVRPQDAVALPTCGTLPPRQVAVLP